MLCCVVLLALLGFVFRRKHTTDPFPPRARRTAAGAPLTSAARLAPPPPSGATTAWVTVARWGAIGAVAYVAAHTVGTWAIAGGLLLLLYPATSRARAGSAHRKIRAGEPA